MKKKILITGVAGFIGFNVARKLLNLNYKIIGIDIGWRGSIDRASALE